MAEISLVAIPHTATNSFGFNRFGATGRIQAKIVGSGTWNTSSGDRLLDIVGYADYVDYQNTRYVLAVEVKEEYRGQGVSREMFDFAAENLPEGMAVAHLNLSSNTDVVTHMISKFKEEGSTVDWDLAPKSMPPVETDFSKYES